MVSSIHCPVCGKPVRYIDGEGNYSPFCSKHCKLADLGKWLTGHYRISEPLDPEDRDISGEDESESNQRDQTLD